MTVLYTGRVVVQSGRDGMVRSDDGKLAASLAFPPALGGSGEGTNPEQLFAAGYAACFASTLSLVAKNAGTPLRDVRVDAEVDMVLEAGTYDLAARLVVRAAGVEPARLRELVAQAEGACPYARMARKAIATSLTVA